MESSKQNKIKPPPAGRSRAPNASAPCRKHPRHRQSPGVCSLCLNERLSQLNNQNCSKAVRAPRSSSWSSSNLSSLSSSSEASSCASPISKNIRIRGWADHQVLNKSRSMASVFHRRKDRHGRYDTRETKRGFWSKLMLFPRRKYKVGMDKNKVLVHSTSTRERVIITALR